MIQLTSQQIHSTLFVLIFSCSFLGPTHIPVGYWGSFPGAKVRPRPDADHSPPSSAEAENE
jgi:hypothetical protein